KSSKIKRGFGKLIFTGTPFLLVNYVIPEIYLAFKQERKKFTFFGVFEQGEPCWIFSRFFFFLKFSQTIRTTSDKVKGTIPLTIYTPKQTIFNIKIKNVH